MPLKLSMRWRSASISNMADNSVIVYADKTVLKISGLKIKGLNTSSIEKIMRDRLNTIVRVIGVTGSEIDMDVYNIDPEQILRDEDGIIRAVATAEGIEVTDVVRLAGAERIHPVDWNCIPDWDGQYCQAERWFGNEE